MTPTMRDRSLGGCGTCRSRHTKCDETRPVCNVCLLSRLTCTGYDIRLQFVYQGETEPSIADGTPRFRRPLFTEAQRKGLNSSLIRSLNDVDPGKALLDLDEQTLVAQPGDYPLILGPFGAFQLQDPNRKELQATDDDVDLDAAVELQQITSEMVEATFASTGDSSTLLDPATLDLGLDGSTVLDNDSVSFDDTLLLAEIDPHNTVSSLYDNYDSHGLHSADDDFSYSSLLYPIPQSTRLPGDSWLLLANYRDNVIPLLCPLIVSKKSPWHHLVLPCAMNTMAEMTMGGSTSYARSALLHTLLATSAFHVQLSSSSPPGEPWSPTVQYYKQRARHDLKCCLQREAWSQVKKAKYKDVLMALISMAILNVFDADADSLLACLLVTEKYICRQGLSKGSLSRKARLLHHCYAYLRIFNETLILSDMSTDSFHDLGVVLDPKSTAKAARFRISRWSDTPDFALTTVKSLELGHHDLHLEYPGRWDLTMYPEIFGIPESFLNLISHVTRLGNERDLLMSGRTDGPFPNTRDFLLRAKLVEEHICGWDPVPCAGSSTSSLTIMLAMQKALLVFFYRRFYDVEASTLQHEVRQIRDLLLRSSKGCGPNIHMVWPGFIAACEALDPDLKEFFRGWLVDAFQQTGLPPFRVARSIAESIWKSDSEGGKRTVQWPDIVRSSNQRLVIF